MSTILALIGFAFVFGIGILIVAILVGAARAKKGCLK